MHEGHFTEQIVEVILRELKPYAEACPKSVKVKVGEMLHLESESVKLHYRVLTQGTQLESTVLELEEIPAVVKCRQCSQEATLEDHHMLVCASCFSRDVELLQGNQILVDSIELVGENTPPT